MEHTFWSKLSACEIAFETVMASETYHSSLRKISGNLQFFLIILIHKNRRDSQKYHFQYISHKCLQFVLCLTYKRE